MAIRAPRAEVAEWIHPPALRPGAAVRIVAPAGPFEARLVWRAMGWLAERYEVRWQRRIFSRRGYFAGDDDAREAELAAALDEPGVAAVFCARGGYGGNRYVHRLDWSRLRASPRWIVGFSDVTALHVEAARVGVASLHGPNLTGLGRGDAAARELVLSLLEGGPGRDYRLDVVKAGEAEGVLVGGNLSLLHSCAAAGRLELPRGCVLMIEEVSEPPYRIDRMLTTLLVGGHLDAVSAVVVGDFEQCRAGHYGVAALEAAATCLEPLGVPIASGLPVGHGVRNDGVILGATVRLSRLGELVTRTRRAVV